MAPDCDVAVEGRHNSAKLSTARTIGVASFLLDIKGTCSSRWGARGNIRSVMEYEVQALSNGASSEEQAKLVGLQRGRPLGQTASTTVEQPFHRFAHLIRHTFKFEEIVDVPTTALGIGFVMYGILALRV